MKTAVFWDFDGTLCYKNQSFLWALERAADQYGYTPDPACCKSFLKEVCSWNQPQISYPDKTGKKWWDQLRAQTEHFMMDLGISDTVAQKISRSFQQLAIHYPYKLYRDAAYALDFVQKKGIPNYLISNNFPELVQVIDRCGLGGYFTDYFLSSLIGYEKPRIEIFRYALEQAGSPDCAYMVGDNRDADISGARAAGMHTILVHTPDACPDADFQCANLTDIISIF